ncbi:glycosyltransferase family 1 protein [Amycolatopsis sp. K13G38]|uniref:Glycosyltransferase family 1 protein n=1 Tax=Amycolatopsis acididurans TaxID=2724524 RepID=A0ABX1J648_9PSEU|nr:glycosyltransferase [Amycolatopsis acididurans]NKQ55054.1 glycosyltransferase family 1 protein [Amycolatopsis acididurans]
MKVLLLTTGSRGDIQPFIALACALNTDGHQVTLRAPTSATPLAESYGVRVAPFGDDWSEILADPDTRAAFETGGRGFRGRALDTRSAPRLYREIRRAYSKMAWDADESLDFDLVVHQAFVPGHRIAGEMGVPAVPVCLQPMWVPTRSFPNPSTTFPVPRELNRASYLATELRVRTLSGRWRDPDSLVLQAFSRHLLPGSADYPESVHTTGFWFVPESAPPADLRKFVAAGEPPVCVTLGSSAEQPGVRQVVADAVRLTGLRTVVVDGSTGTDSAGRVLHVGHAPFDWLLPRVAAVVHHGGSGTTGAALAAGRPQIVRPSLTEQNFFAQRVHALGVAPAPRPLGQLSAGELARAVVETVNDREMAARAGEWRGLIRAEGGVAEAVRALESVHCAFRRA